MLALAFMCAAVQGSVVLGIFSTSAHVDAAYRRWLPRGHALQFVFVHGVPAPITVRDNVDDVVVLNVAETKETMAHKSLAWFAHAKRAYPMASHVFKVDSDTAMCPDALAAMLQQTKHADYIGLDVGHLACGALPYCPEAANPTWHFMQGGFYGLSRRAIGALTNATPTDEYEDVFIGRALHAAMKPLRAHIPCLADAQWSRCGAFNHCPVQHCRSNKARAKLRPMCAHLPKTP